ncbi:MAG: peptidoglycan editing factor PgeF [Oceanococcus sp.]
MSGAANWLEPNWPAIPGVRAAFSLRYPGCSEAPWAGLNLGAHVGDDAQQVQRNRKLLADALGLPERPPWLNQVHGTRLLAHSDAVEGDAADAIWTSLPRKVCAVMVADCLPILLRDQTGQCVAAIHAGWRGLEEGIVGAVISELRRRHPEATWQAWLGPCIGPNAFEVGSEVQQAFVRLDAQAQAHFRPARAGHWLADLRALAQLQLCANGVTDIWRSEACTFNNSEQFFSFRRDYVTGRMAALIWREF